MERVTYQYLKDKWFHVYVEALCLWLSLHGDTEGRVVVAEVSEDSYYLVCAETREERFVGHRAYTPDSFFIIFIISTIHDEMKHKGVVDSSVTIRAFKEDEEGHRDVNEFLSDFPVEFLDEWIRGKIAVKGRVGVKGASVYSVKKAEFVRYHS